MVLSGVCEPHCGARCGGFHYWPGSVGQLVKQRLELTLGVILAVCLFCLFMHRSLNCPEPV